MLQISTFIAQPNVFQPISVNLRITHITPWNKNINADRIAAPPKATPAIEPINKLSGSFGLFSTYGNR